MSANNQHTLSKNVILWYLYIGKQRQPQRVPRGCITYLQNMRIYYISTRFQPQRQIERYKSCRILPSTHKKTN